MLNLKLILERAKEGEKGAEGQIFEFLFVRFSFIAKQRIGEMDADDLAQEACLTVLEKFKSLDGNVNVEAWAYGVLRNKIGNYIKNRAVRTREDVNQRLMKMNDPITQQLNPILRHRLAGCLKKIMSKNIRYARILNFSYHGFEGEEICRRLGITPANFYVLLNRSRRMLKDCVNRGGISI